MGPEARKEYVERMRERYGRMGRPGRTRLLDEVSEVLGCHRKSAIRRLNAKPRASARRPGPKAEYGEEERRVLKDIWLAAEQPCGRRLKAAVRLWLPAYARRWPLSRRLRKKLMKMSASTMDRLLKPVRAGRRVKGLGGTKPGSLLKSQIPIRGQSWDEKRPGYMEADTVGHGGGSMEGEFVWSVTFTDIASGWTENAAVWNKGATGVKERLGIMEKGLAFDLLGFDCDNGGEFLNHHLWSYLRERAAPVEFTRSRPYRKNDQAHVEQKNWTHVRQLLGYERLAWRELVEPINELYGVWGRVHNFFCPTLKLREKSREGARIKRRYEAPKTPYQRLLESDHVAPEKKKELQRRMKELDPFDLKGQVEAQLRRIDSLKRRLEQGIESTIPVSSIGHPNQVAFGNTFP